ncbi:3-hydroxyacyl-CoA dehydrogenase NAD-binding domain-containing protein [Nonomuraea wenchangensis]|uniref:3-hydroxyacyl-CoA dehydrogenase family protein n=1 Tax=Nonomuraea wenchangensis TaxID=568860 RepID=UPI00344634FB
MVNTLPDMVEDTRVAVIGAGLMGHSIAGVFAGAGSQVSLFDTHEPALRQGLADMRRQLLDPEAADGVTICSELPAAVAAAHLVIEAVPERLELKQRIFAEVSDLAPEAVMATNTSVLKIAEVGRRADRRRVLGTHWFNPPHLVPLVEVVESDATDPACVAWVMGVLRQAGKLPVHVRRDIPGFLGNRLQHAMWREALHLVETGACDAETIDLVVRNGFGLRLPAMGPIENADYVGLDLVLAVHEYLFPHLSRDEEPSRLLREAVDAGRLGAKTGAGLLTWPPGRQDEARKRLDAQLTAENDNPAAPRN